MRSFKSLILSVVLSTLALDTPFALPQLTIAATWLESAPTRSLIFCNSIRSRAFSIPADTAILPKPTAAPPIMPPTPPIINAPPPLTPSLWSFLEVTGYTPPAAALRRVAAAAARLSNVMRSRIRAFIFACDIAPDS